MKKYHYIYKTTNLINNKIYVGKHSTNNLNDGYLGSGAYLKKAIKKYGKENFKIEILEKCLPCRHYVNSKEIEWIEKLEAKKIGYNLTDGGEGLFGYEYSEKELLARSERVSGDKNPMYGMTGKLSPNYGNRLSEESKNKIRLSRIGKSFLSDEQKAELSKRMSGKGNPMYGKSGILSPSYGKKLSKYQIEIIKKTHTGKIISEDQKRKQSEAMSGRKLTEEHKEKLRNKLKIQCPYCDKICDAANAKKWHFDNCLENPKNDKNSLKQERTLKSKKNYRPRKVKVNYKLVICPHCGREGKGPNMGRYHFDKCKFKKQVA